MVQRQTPSFVGSIGLKKSQPKLIGSLGETALLDLKSFKLAEFPLDAEVTPVVVALQICTNKKLVTERAITPSVSQCLNPTHPTMQATGTDHEFVQFIPHPTNYSAKVIRNQMMQQRLQPAPLVLLTAVLLAAVSLLLLSASSQLLLSLLLLAMALLLASAAARTAAAMASAPHGDTPPPHPAATTVRSN
jgi:hypothetical protein